MQKWLPRNFSLQRGEAAGRYMINHGAQPILARRPTLCNWLPSPDPVAAKNTPGKMVKIHDEKKISFTLWLLLYLLLLFITLSVLCSKLLKPTEWLSFETPSGSVSPKVQTYFCFVLGSQSAHLLPSSFATSPTLIETWICRSGLNYCVNFLRRSVR